MPWTEPAASLSELRRCIRDLVALSTLPAGWQNYDMRQIGGSIVAALISMLDADFVFIALPGNDNQVVTELARSSPKLDPANLQRVQKNRRIRRQRPARDDRAHRVRWRCNPRCRLYSPHISNQDREAAPQYRSQSGGDRLPAVAGRRREEKVYSHGAANDRPLRHRLAERPRSVR